MKNIDFFTVFRGNIVTDITGNIFSDQGMLFGTFLMKNIFINFPTPILNHGFCSISLKISCFLQHTWQLCTTTADKTYEKHWIFWWNHAKNIVQNRSWKIDEIFFIRNVANNIPWSLKVFPVMPVTIFPRTPIKNPCFFMFGDYCRDSNSKYTHHNTALQQRVFFMRERSQK